MRKLSISVVKLWHRDINREDLPLYSLMLAWTETYVQHNIPHMYACTFVNFVNDDGNNGIVAICVYYIIIVVNVLPGDQIGTV